jgi:cytochrome P450
VGNIQAQERRITPNPDPVFLRAWRGIFWDRIKLLERTGSRHPDIVSSTLGKRELILINRPDYIHEVLVAQAEKFHKSEQFKQFTKPLLGNGLLLSEDDDHRRNRKLVAPAFVHRRIPEYAKVMLEYTERVMNAWHDGDVIDISTEMMRITLAIAGKTLFGSDVSSDAMEVKDKLTFLNHYAEEQLRLPIHLPFSWPTLRNIRVRKAIASLDAIIYRMIAERRASDSDQGDLLSMLLLARDEDDGTGMSDKQVRDEAMTIFIAGHETTGNATSWMWYALAKHPDIFQKLREEVSTVDNVLENLHRLPYALQVFKETLRLYPPVYMTVRTATEDVWVDGYRIKKGVAVMISPYLLHRKSDYFSDPERFDPDRFSIENESHIPRSAYLPFGAGPRICIGNQFALMEGQIIAATIARKFTFELASDAPQAMEPLVTLRPKGGIKVRVRAL